MMKFKVSGMSCGHCVRAITNAVQALDPQARVEADLARAEVCIVSQQPAAALLDAIREEGYAAELLAG